MDFDRTGFDAWMDQRVKEEGSPIPEGFETRLEERLKELPAAEGQRRKLGRRTVFFMVAAVVLTACVGTGVVTLRQARTHYYETMEEAGQAADQAAQEAGASTAAVGILGGDLPDYPDPEPLDMEQWLAGGGEVLEHKIGAEGDGWTEMGVCRGELTQNTIYQADTLEALRPFWPVETPDLLWLEEQHDPVPGCQQYYKSESVVERSSIFDYTGFSGSYYTPQGQPFRLNWSFHPKWQEKDDYMVSEGLDRVEEYTTKDGAQVTIEWAVTTSGQSRFWVDYRYGYADFSMDGASMEPEEIHEILDHMNLPALQSYNAE